MKYTDLSQHQQTGIFRAVPIHQIVSQVKTRTPGGRNWKQVKARAAKTLPAIPGLPLFLHPLCWRMQCWGLNSLNYYPLHPFLGTVPVAFKERLRANVPRPGSERHSRFCDVCEEWWRADDAIGLSFSRNFTFSTVLPGKCRGTEARVELKLFC